MALSKFVNQNPTETCVWRCGFASFHKREHELAGAWGWLLGLLWQVVPTRRWSQRRSKSVNTHRKHDLFLKRHSLIWNQTLEDQYQLFLTCKGEIWLEMALAMRSLLKKIFRQMQDTNAIFRTSVFQSNSATQPLGSANCYSINKTFKRLSSTTLSSMPPGEASPRPLGYALGNTQTLLA